LLLLLWSHAPGGCLCVVSCWGFRWRSAGDTLRSSFVEDEDLKFSSFIYVCGSRTRVVFVCHSLSHMCVYCKLVTSAASLCVLGVCYNPGRLMVSVNLKSVWSMGHMVDHPR
jgi:hypothetical protein